ncbi:TPR end-of-group domain-containing protein [Gemmatimonadota bacterium]
MATRLGVFFAELKRRKVYHVAAAYLAVGVALVFGIPDLFYAFDLPTSAARIVIILIAAGFPVALILAWVYEVKVEEPTPTEATADSTSATLPTSDQRAIVVLPFENLSGDEAQEFFAAGMHDALITELAQIGGLRVISRTSSMIYKDKRVSVPEIARELNVDGIIEASVLRVGDTVRIQAQLIEAAPEERHLWAHQYDRELSDVLALHSEVARAVAREVQVEMTAGDDARLASRRRVDPETYELYLKGMFHIHKYTPEGFQKGMEYLNHAVEKDPTEPLPLATMALAWVIIGHSPGAPLDALPNARTAALKALELDENLAEAHAALAEVRIYYEWDVDGAGESFRRALELNPSLAEARGHYSWYLILEQGYDVAVEELKRARQADPLHPVFSGWLGWMLVWAGRLEEVEEEARKSLELHPDFPMGLSVLGGVLAEMGRFEEAYAAHQRAGAISPMWGWGLGTAYALAGRSEEAREFAREMQENFTQWDTWGLAEIYATLGDNDEAMRWLEEAVDQRHSYIMWINHFPPFRPLRDDPRFQELARRVGAPG